MIIQWGNKQASGTADVSLHINFSNTNYIVLLTQLNASLGAWDANAYVHTRSESSFNISAQATNTLWLAIGY